MQNRENRQKRSNSKSSLFENWTPEYKSLAFGLFDFVSIVANRFLLDCENLLSSPGREFLRNRGIDLDEAREFGIGYLSSTVTFNRLYKQYASRSERKIMSREYARGILLRTLIFKETDCDFYPSRGDALVLPERSPDGDVVNLFLRQMDKQTAEKVKFASLKGFSKKTTSYGLRHSFEAISRLKTAIIVEGPFDYLSLVRGICKDQRIVVAPVGCQIFSELVDKLIACGCEHIVFALDGDDAGVKATLIAIEHFYHYLIDRGLTIGWLRWSKGSDPDDLLRWRGTELRERILAGVISGNDFTIENRDAKDGILCRFVSRVNCNTIIPETCIELDIDRIQIPSTSSKSRRGKSDFQLLRMRCAEASKKANAFEGRGITIPLIDYELLLADRRFSTLAIVIILLKAVAHGFTFVQLRSLEKQTSLSGITLLRALKSKSLRPFFAFQVDTQTGTVKLEPTASLKSFNYEVLSAFDGQHEQNDDVDVPTDDSEFET